MDIHECIHCEFVTRSEGVLFSVYGAHLKSGEAYASEAKRCGQLEGILRHMQGKGVNGDSDGAAAPIEPVQNPILAMDSNNSLFYEAEYTPAATGAADPVTVSKLLDQYGFRDTLRNQSGLECFKMRHNQGGQPKKFFNIMFDRIDKIVVRKNTISEDCDADYGFLRYDSNMPHSSHSGGSDCAIETAASLGAVGVSSDFIRGIRLSGEKREELKAFCILKVQQLLVQITRAIAWHTEACGGREACHLLSLFVQGERVRIVCASLPEQKCTFRSSTRVVHDCILSIGVSLVMSSYSLVRLIA